MDWLRLILPLWWRATRSYRWRAGGSMKRSRGYAGTQRPTRGRGVRLVWTYGGHSTVSIPRFSKNLNVPRELRLTWVDGSLCIPPLPHLIGKYLDGDCASLPRCPDLCWPRVCTARLKTLLRVSVGQGNNPVYMYRLNCISTGSTPIGHQSHLTRDDGHLLSTSPSGCEV